MNVKLLLLFADVSQHIIKNEWPCETTRQIFRPKTLIFLLQLHMVASVALNPCHCMVSLYGLRVGLLAQVRKTLHLILYFLLNNIKGICNLTLSTMK